MPKICNQNVINFDNSWVVCKSKSYNGRVYYFNTLTGVATWNLSDIEKEKSYSTANLVSRSDIPTGKYPEPKNSPYDHSNICSSSHNYDQTQAVLLKGNDNSINNTAITHIQMPLLTKGHCCHCKHTLIHADIPKSPEDKQNFCNNSLNPIQCNNIKFCNKVNHNNLRFVQTTTLSLNKRFEKSNTNFDKNIVNVEKFNKVLFNEIEVGTGNPKRFDFKNDLRQLLSSKRNTELLFSNDSTVTSHVSGVNKRAQVISENTAFNKLQQEDSNKPYLNQRDSKLKIERNKLDLTLLKNIAKRSEGENRWNIVADVDVFLYHHNFLEILVDSDQDCRLIVLLDVLVSLQQASRCENKIANQHAQHSINFILKNIVTGSLILTKGPRLVDNTGKALLDSCIKLVQDNYHNIILLCNDINLKEYKDIAPIPIFSVNELKLYLISNDTDESGIRRDAKEKTGNKSLDKFSNKATESLSNDNCNRHILLPSNISEEVQTDNLTSPKQTADAEVQTDLTSEILTRIFSNENVQNILSNNFEKCCQEEVNREIYFNGKQFKLKLNRSTSDQSKTSTDKDTMEKRNFKWRRKRHKSSVGQNNDVYLHEDEIKESRIEEVPSKILKFSIDSLENQSNNISNNNSNDQSIAETSTRVVALDAPKSTLDSESDNRENLNKNLFITLYNKNINENKNVMFEVNGQDMEDNLRTRCDEWVTRFVQIMEALLTLLLQNDPLGFHNSLSPSHSLFEAIQYIKMRFYNDNDIVDAACKLVDTLQRTSEGEIKVNINPDQYMEMYSYGVYLVDALQAAESNNEDIQKAAEALAKLLNDINNPIQDTTKDESFIDEANEILENDGNITDTEPEKNSPTFNQEQSGTLPSCNSQSECNLMSSANESNTEKESGDPIIRNSVDEISLPILNLDRNKGCEKDIAANVFQAHTLTPEPMLPETTQEGISELVINNKTLSVPIKQGETKFIRNFTHCAGFEERIKDKEMLKSNDEMDGTYSDDDCSGTDCFSKFLYEGCIESEENDENNYNKSSDTTNDENNTFKNFLRNFLQEIRGSFFLIYCFCLEFQKRRNTNELGENNGTLLKAKAIHTNLSDLCNVLNSIYEMDEETSAKKISTELKCADFQGLTYNEIDLIEYKSIIAKCLDQANILREGVKAILCTYVGVSPNT